MYVILAMVAILILGLCSVLVLYGKSSRICSKAILLSLDSIRIAILL